MRASRPCSPKSSASLTGSRSNAAKAAQVQRRVKALDKIEKSNCQRNGEWVEIRFPPTSAIRRPGRDAGNIRKTYGRRVVYDGLNLNVRRGERWCVMGKNGAGKSTLLKIISGAIEPDSGTVRLGASLTMGYFAQQALDLLNPDLTSRNNFIGSFPMNSIGSLRQPRRRLPVLRRGRGQESPRALRRRKDPAGDGPDADVSAEFPGAGRTDESSGCRDQRNADRCAEDVDGTMLFVSHDRTFLRGLSNRVVELGGESGTDSEPHIYPGSYTEYVAAYRPMKLPACTTELVTYMVDAYAG